MPEHMSLVCMCQNTAGQASVETALLLPTTFFLIAFLVQPLCLYYTRSVMLSASAETARLAYTCASDERCKAFAQARLSAVPEVSIFHVGGDQDWEVLIERGDELSVEIRAHARPLPLFSLITGAFSEKDSVGIVLRAKTTYDVRPSWLEGEYENWQLIWN